MSKQTLTEAQFTYLWAVANGKAKFGSTIRRPWAIRASLIARGLIDQEDKITDRGREVLHLPRATGEAK